MSPILTEGPNIFVLACRACLSTQVQRTLKQDEVCGNEMRGLLPFFAAIRRGMRTSSRLVNVELHVQNHVRVPRAIINHPNSGFDGHSNFFLTIFTFVEVNTEAPPHLTLIIFFSLHKLSKCSFFL